MDVFLSHKRVLITRPGTSREPISYGGHRSSKSILSKENTAIWKKFSAGTRHSERTISYFLHKDLEQKRAAQTCLYCGIADLW